METWRRYAIIYPSTREPGSPISLPHETSDPAPLSSSPIRCVTGVCSASAYCPHPNLSMQVDVFKSDYRAPSFIIRAQKSTQFQANKAQTPAHELGRRRFRAMMHRSAVHSEQVMVMLSCSPPLWCQRQQELQRSRSLGELQGIEQCHALEQSQWQMGLVLKPGDGVDGCTRRAMEGQTVVWGGEGGEASREGTQSSTVFICVCGCAWEFLRVAFQLAVPSWWGLIVTDIYAVSILGSTDIYHLKMLHQTEPLNRYDIEYASLVSRSGS